MPNVAVHKASLWRETWKAFQQNAKSLAPWIIGYAIFESASFLYSYITTDSSQLMQQQVLAIHQAALAKKHTAVPSPDMHESGGNALVSFAFAVIGFFVTTGSYYFFTAYYLRLAMKNNRPEYSVGNYFYWLGKMILKWLRLFWALIPIVGFFYLYAVNFALPTRVTFGRLAPWR